MTLTAPVERELIHTRAIDIRGYQRSDGLFDIEAHLKDTKTRGFTNRDRGTVRPGEPLHEMWVRLTIDDRMVIVESTASTEHGPYTVCSGGARSYAELTGLRIKPGFLREANAGLGGTAGCTHLREMLQEIATTAYQTMWNLRARKDGTPKEEEDGSARLLNTCFAYASSSPAVAKRWPELYTGPDATHPDPVELMPSAENV